MDYFELFLRYDYPETKDLCKQFLTLVVAVLVFSLTFSEKIIDFRMATKREKAVLVAAWSAFIAAIVVGGVGLLLISIAGGQAAYRQPDYAVWAQYAYRTIVVAGALFVTGLMALLASAITSLLRAGG